MDAQATNYFLAVSNRRLTVDEVYRLASDSGDHIITDNTRIAFSDQSGDKGLFSSHGPVSVVKVNEIESCTEPKKDEILEGAPLYIEFRVGNTNFVLYEGDDVRLCEIAEFEVPRFQQ